MDGKLSLQLNYNNNESDNNRDSEVQTPYAIAKLGESTRAIRQAINELPVLRKRLEKNMAVKPKAREIYDDLKNQHSRLLGALDTTALSLLEAELTDLADHSVKLRQSIKAFNLMTPDYTKLCAVFNNYMSVLPFTDMGEISTAGDTAPDETQTTNNRIIGRLMNNVRMGYYPTSTDNLAHIELDSNSVTNNIQFLFPNTVGTRRRFLPTIHAPNKAVIYLNLACSSVSV